MTQMPGRSRFCTDAEWEALLHAYPILMDGAKLPPLVRSALSTYGLKETHGPGTTPFIQQMLDDLGPDAGPVHDDDQAWCSIWMAWTAKRSGCGLPAAPSWSHAWLRMPGAIAVPISQATLGDVAVFGRDDWKKQLGHPAIVIQLEDYGNGWPFVHVIGGNQGDQVSVIAKNAKQLIGVLRPCSNAI